MSLSAILLFPRHRLGDASCTAACQQRVGGVQPLARAVEARLQASVPVRPLLQRGAQAPVLLALLPHSHLPRNVVSPLSGPRGASQTCSKLRSRRTTPPARARRPSARPGTAMRRAPAPAARRSPPPGHAACRSTCDKVPAWSSAHNALRRSAPLSEECLCGPCWEHLVSRTLPHMKLQAPAGLRTRARGQPGGAPGPRVPRRCRHRCPPPPCCMTDPPKHRPAAARRSLAMRQLSAGLHARRQVHADGSHVSRARLSRSTSRCRLWQRRVSQRTTSAWCSTTAAAPRLQRPGAYFPLRTCQVGLLPRLCS